ncbi:MAG: OmpH family outer membrane protein [Bacteroidales bacterium]|nr:OmpH family outer membrane protein [Bacteroidales bacterium]HPD95584.1 OmpH family outer membrane protein [Tenuifilaceae bacterium]HRX31732.1 OmpH family outer membrane protein [Tenuifilaceae bacterium]
MKKVNLIFNIVLTLAVIALFVLFFTSRKNVVSNGTIALPDSTIKSPIAWVDMDTILNSYDMYYDMKAELEQSSKKLEEELNAKSKSFEKEANDFQNKVQKGLITRSEAQQLQNALAQKEQELYNLRDNMRMQLSEEEQVKLRKIHNSITEYIKEYNVAKGYSVVLSYSFGGQVLYGHPSIDITKEVIKGLNEKYATTRNSK